LSTGSANTTVSSAPLAAGPDCAAWQQLASLARELGARSTRSLFDGDAERFRHCSAEAAGLLLDYSRQRIDARVIGAFGELAEQLGLRNRIAAMFRGDAINRTENRAVLHTALRRPALTRGDGALLSQKGSVPSVEPPAEIDTLVQAERKRLLRFAGCARKQYKLVVNIGIGGSDLGPAMAVEALRQHQRGAPRVAFVSNVDGVQLADLLATANPRHTLFVICSKTFTTQETRANADAARAWLARRLGARAVPRHFAAVSVNAKAMDAFGIHPDNRFAMWDWVGGRYSIWSSIGLSLAIAIGAQNFKAFLAGGRAMDEHFTSAPWRDNLPLLAALLGIWNVNLLELPTLAVLPYDQRLARFPAYLQQLEMESNGKSVRMDGRPVATGTCPVVWGEPGNPAQHSFFQMLHQGTPRAALDFLLPAKSSCGNQRGQELAIANCLAQAEAFAFGQASDNPHKVHVGNRPVSLLLFRKLDPFTLGTLIALYEHKVFVQGVVWGVNSFDQWGVELGKKLCEGIVPLVRNVAGKRGNRTATGEGSVPISSSLRGALAYLKPAS
jgi:glucose-6-phosphate isomerase